ncbi:MAG: glycosyltransferase [Bacteroidetes bacterium]|nr:MAG: glycosyltransferase [Bacteroidota bacterium]
MIYLCIGFLLIRLLVSATNYLSRPWLAETDIPAPVTGLSVLIPARNEVENLPRLLEALSHLEEDMEILVLNDQSEDGTEALLQAWMDKEPRLRYLNGEALPAGWLGKNRACHQLAQEAKGRYLLFLDADVAAIDPSLPRRAVHDMNKRGLALLSLFPDQIMKSQGERIVVPLMHYLLLSLLPLWWIFRLPFPSMAAANGQFMLFDAEAYRRFQWHARVKSVIVEDIAIMQEIKKAGLKGMTYVARGAISTRMYGSLREGVAGFSKNILAGFGNSIPAMAIFLFLIFFGWLLVAGQLSAGVCILALGMIAGIRMFVSLSAGQLVWQNLLLHPAQMLLLLYISALSIIKRISGKNEWKGRNVQLQG